MAEHISPTQQQEANHWFGGNGSVKELVRAFQGHVNEVGAHVATQYIAVSQ